MAFFLFAAGAATATYFWNNPEAIKAKLNDILNKTVPPAFPKAVQAIDTFCDDPSPNNLTALANCLRAVQPDDHPNVYSVLSQEDRACVAGRIRVISGRWLTQCQDEPQNTERLRELLDLQPQLEGSSPRRQRLIALRALLENVMDKRSGVWARAVSGPVADAEQRVNGLLSAAGLPTATRLLNNPGEARATLNAILNRSVPQALPDAIQAVDTFCSDPTPDTLANLAHRLDIARPDNHPNIYSALSPEDRTSASDRITAISGAWLGQCQQLGQTKETLRALMDTQPQPEGSPTRRQYLMVLRKLLEDATNAEAGVLPRVVNGPVAGAGRAAQHLVDHVAGQVAQLPAQTFKNTQTTILGPNDQSLLQVSFVALATLAAMVAGSIYGSTILVPATVVIIPTTTLLLITWLWFRSRPAAAPAGQAAAAH